MISEAQIQAVVQRIVDGYAPDQIILFGSYAYGVPTADSDLDLLIIKKDAERRGIDRDLAVRHLVMGGGDAANGYFRSHTAGSKTSAKPVIYRRSRGSAKGPDFVCNSLKTPVQIKVHTLLRVADRDVETAESLVQHSPHLFESIGFSCQQATEKYLKAVLVANGLPAPFIHDLTSLATGLVGQVVFDYDDVSAATILTSFAVKWRYERDDDPDFTVADILNMMYRFRTKLRPLALAFLN